ncbi:MAG: hypothetical protein N3D73_00035 [Candidatus Diapherotrites archaeon]|nr:hypothetical protein [Candidatus Diapherotrites archaeon]
MLIVGNRIFVVSMRLGGIKNSVIFESRQQVLDLIKKIDKKEIIVVNKSVFLSVPELKEFQNLVVLPDNFRELKNDNELKEFVKDCLGFYLEV